jgi:hypothetical protein
MGHWHLLFRQIEPIGEPGIPGQVLRTGNWKAAHSHIPIRRLIGTWRLRSRYTIWNPSNELTLYLGMNGEMPNCQLPPGEGSIGIIQFSLEVRVLEPGFLFV